MVLGPLSLLGQFSSQPSARSAERASKRRMIRKRMDSEDLEMFLHANHFNSIHAPRAAWLGTRPKPETIYPIHAAAVAGSANILRGLLKKGVDPEQLTSMGRSPQELAEEANHGESHEDVLDLLKNKVKILNFKSAKALMEQAANDAISKQKIQENTTAASGGMDSLPNDDLISLSF